MIEIYSDRVDIVSPGGVCKGITRDNFGTISIARNSVIASMLHRIGYIEQMGTGIMRMKNAAIKANIAQPEFEFEGFFKVTFRRIASDSQAVASGHKRSQAVVPTDRKQSIINYLKKHGQAQTPDLINVIGLTNSRVRALLRKMVTDGTIEKIGDNRYTYYILKTPKTP